MGRFATPGPSSVWQKHWRDESALTQTYHTTWHYRPRPLSLFRLCCLKAPRTSYSASAPLTEVTRRKRSSSEIAKACYVVLDLLLQACTSRIASILEPLPKDGIPAGCLCRSGLVEFSTSRVFFPVYSRGMHDSSNTRTRRNIAWNNGRRGHGPRGLTGGPIRGSTRHSTRGST